MHDFVAPGGQPGGAQAQARNPATDHRRLCPGGGEVTWLSRSSALLRSTPISRQNGRAAGLRGRSRRQHRTHRRRHPGRRQGARRCGGGRIHQPLRPRVGWLAGRPGTVDGRTAEALDGLSADRRTALEAAAGRIRAYHERQKLEGWSLHRSRRHDARPEDHAARPRRPLRAGRQGGVSVVGADERDSGQGRRRQGTDHGGADAGRREATSWCWRRPRWPASTACSPSAARRRSARWPTARRPCRRWTRSSAPATPTSPRPSAACSASSASTWSPARRKS